MAHPVIRPFEQADLPWAETLIGSDFEGRLQARLGEVVDALAYPGLAAELEGKPVGLLTYRLDGREAEIVYLEAAVRGTLVSGPG